MTESTQLIEKALESGAGPEQIQGLIELVKHQESEAARRAYNEAFTKAQGDIPVIPKNGHVDYIRKDGVRVQYDHALFHEEVKILKPILKKHGLSFRHKLDDSGEKTLVTCVIAHKKGHQETSSLAAPPDTSGGKNSHQGIGAAVTYLKRYTLEASVGLTTDNHDDDGAGAEEGLGAADIKRLNETISKAKKKESLLQKILQAYNIDNIGQIKPDEVERAIGRCEDAIERGA